MSISRSLQQRRSSPLLRLIPYLRRYKPQLYIGTAMVLLTNLAAVLSPWILRAAINRFQSEDLEMRLILTYAGLIVIFSLIEGTFRFLMNMSSCRIIPIPLILRPRSGMDCRK